MRSHALRKSKGPPSISGHTILRFRFCPNHVQKPDIRSPSGRRRGFRFWKPSGRAAHARQRTWARLVWPRPDMLRRPAGPRLGSAQASAAEATFRASPAASAATTSAAAPLRRHNHLASRLGSRVEARLECGRALVAPRTPRATNARFAAPRTSVWQISRPRSAPCVVAAAAAAAAETPEVPTSSVLPMGKLLPMCGLFFFMAFCNSVLDRRVARNRSCVATQCNGRARGQLGVRPPLQLPPCVDARLLLLAGAAIAPDCQVFALDLSMCHLRVAARRTHLWSQRLVERNRYHS